MLLSYRDPQFWQNFHANHWRPRVPTVIRQPFKKFPFDEASVLRALNTVEHALSQDDERIRYTVSVGAADNAPRRRLREVIPHACTTMAQFEQRCTDVFPKKSFGVMLNELQSQDSGIWDAVTSFLQDAHPWIDFPVPRAFLDLFFGNYASSFVGLHKDIQEIFAFVLKGEKRMLAWPFDYFAKVEKLSPAARYFQMRLKVDYRKHRKAAVVLDAKPGDLIYWPADHWHIAEGTPGQFSTMISLGISRPEYDIPLLDPLQIRFKQKLITGSTDAARAKITEARSQDMTEVTSVTEAARKLRWVTSFGFELGGPMVKTRDLGEALTVKKKESSLVLWTLIPARRRLLVAVNGHSATVPHSTAVVDLLERLARGESVSVAKPRARAKNAAPTKISETTWDLHGKLKTRALATKRDAEGSLVQWLLRVQAVEAAS